MLSSILGPALLLLASAVGAQETPSVVTFISISPVPTTEEVFTIQTSVPGTLTTPCYEVCVQEPCTACPSDPLMSIPPGETPLPSSETVVSIITDPIRPSDSGVMGIPSGETPISTGSMDIPATAQPSLSVSVSQSQSQSRSLTPTSRPSLSSSAPPQQSTNAASPATMGDGVPFVVALAGAALALL
ncbi:hypothetical protein BKA66DRAFT_606922 [Pyrenochaeta sp. MPI-SDFR-AT-0127]|nr:hypothetical protein BKA66DRAFT_606922 [Pyrenochaeta sp. MPI-SDFR-AT-0127]